MNRPNVLILLSDQQRFDTVSEQQDTRTCIRPIWIVYAARERCTDVLTAEIPFACLPGMI